MAQPQNSHPGQLLQLLTDAQSAMARLFENRSRHLGLTRPQWRVLAGLHGNNGLTQTELSERIAIARSPLGKIVDQLENQGYVERRHDPDDRRINRLYLTTAVEPLIGPVTELVLDLEQQLLTELADRDALLENLVQLVSRLTTMIERELHAAQPADSLRWRSRVNS